MGGIQRISRVETAPIARFAIGEIGFAVLSLVIIVLGVVATAIACGTAYHLAAYGVTGPIRHFASVGLLLAVIYERPWQRLDTFRIQEVVSRKFSLADVIAPWTYAFCGLGLVAFLLKVTQVFSRGWLVVLYVVGCGVLLALEWIRKRIALAAIDAQRIEPHRVLLLGTDGEIKRFSQSRILTARSSAQIVSAIALPDDAVGSRATTARMKLDAALHGAIAAARRTDVTDVVLLTDWGHADFIDDCVEQFAQLPVALHLEARDLARRFNGLKVDTIGDLRTIALAGPPMGSLDSAAKRAFDLVVAAVAVVLLSPAFLVIAALIKLDSKGPVFFRQHRVGYNQNVFRIWKFRTMTTLDDGDTIVQASRNDARITRVGAWLRRFNIDELPQIFNVLKGEMSIVGPRPHAVAHDRDFEKRVDLYPRRLKVPPGITGWAQVHGFRGETDTDDKMRGRVEHDLHYIDNWSLGLDIYIVAMTLVSPRTYRNAY